MAAAAGKQERYRLLLVGKTGNGKSALGNTILGQTSFKVVGGLSSGTRHCNMLSNDAFQIIDTPGVTDTHHTPEDVVREITKFMSTLSPGPHAILFVVRANGRFTDEEYNAYVEMKKLLGKDMASHTIVVFTGGDVVREKSIDLEKEMRNASQNFQAMMKEVGHRYTLINNEATDEGEKQSQLMGLINQIKQLAKEHMGRKSPFYHDINAYKTSAIQKIIEEKKLTKDQAREEYDKQVMEYGTKPMPPPYNFPKAEERVKTETDKTRVNIKICTFL